MKEIEMEGTITINESNRRLQNFEQKFQQNRWEENIKHVPLRLSLNGIFQLHE
jgi:hypothetical protein